MVKDDNYTYGGDYLAMYKNTEPLYCTSETNIILLANYTSIKNKKKGCYRPISLMNVDAKFLNKMLANPNQ